MTGVEGSVEEARLADTAVVGERQSGDLVNSPPLGWPRRKVQGSFSIQLYMKQTLMTALKQKKG